MIPVSFLTLLVVMDALEMIIGSYLAVDTNDRRKAEPRSGGFPHSCWSNLQLRLRFVLAYNIAIVNDDHLPQLITFNLVIAIRCNSL